MQRALLPLVLLAATLSTAAVLEASGAHQDGRNADQVHSGVYRALREQGRASVIVAMKDTRPEELLRPQERRLQSTPRGMCGGDDEVSATEVNADTNDNSNGTQAAQVQAMVERLEEYSLNQHHEVLELLERSNGSSSKSGSLWISNEVYIRDATPELIANLSQLPSVGSIREEAVAQLSIASVSILGAVNAVTNLVGEWGVETIRALDVWELGYQGTNVRVASIDSGVRATHSALVGNFLGDYGWYDPISNLAEPFDASGHGTGVMGVLAGANGYGVAPQAKWMTCRACDATDACRESDLLECAQFLTCPFVVSEAGTTMNCSKKPDVINNSWNTDRGTTAFDSVIDVWVSAGIIPVFSSGNSGSGCATVSSPADGDAGIAVGATDYLGALSSFSGRGPGLDGKVKPDLVAPGETIVSPGSSSDESLQLYSGTSMAAPHVSGAVALLIEAFPDLSTAEVKALLQQSAEATSGGLLSTTTSTCDSSGSVLETVSIPNNAFGYGLVNVQKAVALQKAVLASSTSSHMHASSTDSDRGVAVNATASSSGSASNSTGDVNVGDP